MNFSLKLLEYAPVIFVVVLLVIFSLFLMFGFFSFKQKPFLNKTLQHLVLQDKVILNHNSIRLRFALPSRKSILGLPVGQHVKFYVPNLVGRIAGEWNGCQDPFFKSVSESTCATTDELCIERKYTPVTGDEVSGYVDFVIKVYRGGENPKYIDGGKASQYLDSIKIGDTVTIRGPIGLVKYLGSGNFLYGSKSLHEKKKLLMIAGGTGITPIFQLIKTIINDPKDKTLLYLLYANQTEHDILLHKELQMFVDKNPKQLQIFYTVDRPTQPLEWKHFVGYVSCEMIKKIFPEFERSSLALLCGPPLMVHQTCRPALTSMGWPVDHILTF
jgi:NAD(P)H-flavin reductase